MIDTIDKLKLIARLDAQHHIVLEFSEANLWTLEVNQHGNWSTGDFGRLAYPHNPFLMLGMRAMRGVDACHVHAGPRQLEDLFLSCGGRSQGAHNFRSTHDVHPT